MREDRNPDQDEKEEDEKIRIQTQHVEQSIKVKGYKPTWDFADNVWTVQSLHGED